MYRSDLLIKALRLVYHQMTTLVELFPMCVSKLCASCTLISLIQSELDIIIILDNIHTNLLLKNGHTLHLISSASVVV